MKHKPFVLFALLVTACNSELDAPPRPSGATSGFVHPESVLWDPESRSWFVSNIGEFGTPGDGFVSRLDADGKLQEQPLYASLDDPKGLGILEGRLYVADLSQLVIIDLKDPKQVERIAIPGAVFLNDVAIDPARRAVYLSDSFGNAIFRYQKGKVNTVLQDPRLETPNGLAVRGRELFIASIGPDPDPATFIPTQPGRLWSLNLETKALSTVTDRFASLDGLIVHGDEFLVSDTYAGVYHVSATGETELYVDASQARLQGAADLGFDPESRRLAVPQLFGDTVSFFTFD